MREKGRESRLVYSFLVFLAVAIITFGSTASATEIKWSQDRVDGTYIAPGGQGELVNFTIKDGGDILLRNTTNPGKTVSSFKSNRTVFLNQSFETESGLNGYDSGDDIVRIELLSSGGLNETFDGYKVLNFSSETLFSDGGVNSNAVFDGDMGTGEKSEIVLRDNGTTNGELDSSDFVVSGGHMNLSNFSEKVTFTDASGDSLYNGSEAIIEHSSKSDRFTLDGSDNILKSGDAGIKSFDNDGDLRYFGNDSSEFFSNMAIIDSGDNYLEDTSNIVRNGSVEMVDASTHLLSYFNSSGSSSPIFDNEGEPIYREELPQDNFVNLSETRLGEVEVISDTDSDPNNVELNLTVPMKINSSWDNVSSNDLGKELYPVWSNLTGYGSDGSFRVYEFSDNGVSGDGVWNPDEGTAGDQDILVYDKEGGPQITSGDVLLYNEDPSNNNISIEVGEEFGEDPPSDFSGDYTVNTEVGFDDNNSDGHYDPGNESVLINVSYGSDYNVVQISNKSELPALDSSANFTEKGEFKFWNSSKTGSGTGEPVTDGLYVDMNDTGNVSHGDLRLGRWKFTEPAGNVSKNDLDLGTKLTDFSEASDVKFIDDNGDGDYTAFSGSEAGNKSVREAMVVSDNSFINSSDDLVRAGRAGLQKFSNSNIEYFNLGSGEYQEESAIIKNKDESGILEREDKVLVPGNASLDNFSKSTKFVETGNERGFEQDSNESIIFDGDQDGFIERGNLSSGEHKVLRDGEANLMNFSQPPEVEERSGLVYIDRNSTGQYNAGEDIFNLTLVTHGGSGSSISNTTVYNFANTTRHNGTGLYQDGDVVVNDTDDNQVYKDVLEDLTLENIFTSSSSYEEPLSDEEVTDGLKLFAKGEEIATLTSSGSKYSWSSAGIEYPISGDTIFNVNFSAKSKDQLGSRAYGLKFETNSVDTKGESLTRLDCVGQCPQRFVDAHPPEFGSAYTGTDGGGNNSNRDEIFIEIIEQGAGLNPGSFNSEDFEINSSKFEVIDARKTDTNGNIILTLNGSMPTNMTPFVDLTGSMSDFPEPENVRESDSVEAKDGLRPLIEDISYLDEDVDGTLDMLEVVFSERVNYTRFDASGWEVESNGVPCIQALAPGNEASFCSTDDRMINVTSGSDSSVFQEAVNLSSMDYVNSSNYNSSEYEIGGELYNVTDSNTGYGGNGSFVVHEFNTSEGVADGVWNPNETADQDVLVYSVNGTNLTPGDVLIYDEASSNDNITVEVGEEFSSKDVEDSTIPSNSYRVNTTVGYVGTGAYNSSDHNVSVNVSYNASGFDEPNSTFVSLVPGVNELGITGDFNSAGKVKFWNTSGSDVEPVSHGLFVDMNSTGNISHGDVRLGEWTLPDAKQLYRHEITSKVDSQTAGSALNNTLINLSSSEYGSVGVENMIGAEIANSSRELDVSDNITSVNVTEGGKALNISFNTSKYDVNLSETDRVSVSYYSKSDTTVNDVDAIELNSKASGGVYDGIGTLNQTNTSVVEINATALEGVTGTSGDEPAMNFTVLNNLVSDQSGNTLTNTSESITLTDEAGPAVTEASTEDRDNDARIDTIEMTFSEDLDDAASNYSSAFNISNGSIQQAWTETAETEELSLNVTDVGGTAFTPNLTVYNSTVNDESGNSIDMKQNFSTVEDSANPILLNAEIDPVKSNSDHTFIDMQFSEKTAGTEANIEAINVSGQGVEFNDTGYSMNLSINYTEQLQTGDTPNITLVEGLRDDSGNNLETFEQERVPVNTFRREFVKGWNFVSFPIATASEPNISDVLDVSKVDVVWKYESGEWRTYDPEAPTNDFTRIRGGEGYYVKATENHTLTPNVENKVETSTDFEDLSELGDTVEDDWNLIGNIQEYNQRPSNDEAFVSLSANLSSVSVKPVLGQKYDNGSKILDTSPPLKDDQGKINGEMMPGEAYWAEMTLSDENATYRIPVSDIP